MAGKRAIIWAAVSSEEQAAGDKESLQHQERLGREAAARHGLDVVGVITSDDSRSLIRLDVAMRNPRLGYAALVDAIERRTFDVLIYYDSDRLGRNRALVAQVQEECIAARVALYDLSNPPRDISADVGSGQRVMWSIQGANAQDDVERFKRRARFGRTARARKGLFLHAIPYGYTRGEDGKIVTDPGPAAIVRRIFASYLDGHGLPRIAASLNADGIPTPHGSTWQVGTVGYILDNVLRYAGWLEHNRYSRAWGDPYLRTRGQWPPLITEADAARIQAERSARAANRKLADTPHLLSGVCWCMDCNRPMRLCTHRDPRRPHQPPRTYVRCHAGAAHAYWSLHAPAVLQYVLAELARLTTVDVDAILDADAQAADPAADIAAAQRDIDRLRRMLQAADDDYYIAGKLDADRHERTVSRLQSEIANRQTQLDELRARQQQAADRDSRRARLLDALANGPAILRDADPTAANVWLRTHIRVWLKDKEVLIVEWL